MLFRTLLIVPLALPFVFAVPANLQQPPGRVGYSKPLYRNVESQLSQLAQQAVRGGVIQSGLLASRAPVSEGDRVAVTIRASGGGEAIARAMESRGATVVNIEADVVEAYVSLLDIPELSNQPGVLRVGLIRPPALDQVRPTVGLGAVVSEGVMRHNAHRSQNAGITGTGIRVGVIDGGFSMLRAIRNQGELPRNIRPRCYSAAGRFNGRLVNCERDTAHGTAVAEALLDVAPGVTLYIANPVSLTDLQRSARWMVNQGVTVINHSVRWPWSGPGDGTSRFSNAAVRTVDEAVQRGALWVASAGNTGRSTWTGPYRDRDNDLNLDFNPGGAERNRIQLTPGESAQVQMRWQDTWNRAVTDLDVFLENASGQVVASSEDFQTGDQGQDPFEFFTFTDPRTSGTQRRNYFVTIAHFAGPTPNWIQVQAFSGQDLQLRQAGRSVGNPAESGNPGLLAVGAANQRTVARIENFSARGPTRDGRVKPDIVGADNGDSAVWGPWLGTSQAAPHVAGAAALVVQQERVRTGTTLSPAQIATRLKNAARGRGARPNNTWGFGFAWVPDP